MNWIVAGRQKKAHSLSHTHRHTHAQFILYVGQTFTEFLKFIQMKIFTFRFHFRCTFSQFSYSTLCDSWIMNDNLKTMVQHDSEIFGSTWIPLTNRTFIIQNEYIKKRRRKRYKLLSINHLNVYKEVDRSAFAMKNWINLNVLFYFAITLKMSKVPLNRSSCSICFSICQLFTQFYESEAFHLMHSVDIYLKNKMSFNISIWQTRRHPNGWYFE